MHLKPDPSSDEGQLLATEVDDEMGRGAAGPPTREAPPAAATAQKRGRFTANSPYLHKDDSTELEFIKVPTTLEFSEELEKAVRAYNELAAANEKGLEAPPVQAKYPDTEEGKWTAEMHYAILQTQQTSLRDWHRFPVFKEYISARSSGPRHPGEGIV